jgi:gliding motility-associated-like protein
MRFFGIIFFIFSLSASAQPPCGSPGGTPASAIAVCGTLGFPQNTLPNCTGPDIPQGNNVNNVCSGNLIGSSNSIWYKFRCYQSGTLGFLITPSVPTHDYDWSLMNVTGRPVTDVFTIPLSISSNSSPNTTPLLGATGCTPTGALDYGCGTSGFSQFNRMPNVVAGGDYLLMVTKYTTSGIQGYTLNFTGGTAVLTNPLPPTITSVSSVGCNLSQVRVTFSEDIKCISLTTNGSEFTITNGANVIIGVSYACSSGSNTVTELTLNLQNPLSGGAHNLVVGGSLRDVCDDAMIPVSFPFSVNASPPAPTVTVAVPLCQGITATALTAGGTNLLWYTTATGGTGTATAPIPSTAATGSTNYYVSQTIGGCESPRSLITVTVSATPGAPLVISPIDYCQNFSSTPLTANGSSLLWYLTASGGVGSSIAPTPTTAAPGSTIYYVSQTSNGCESVRAAITVNVTATPALPVVISPINYCQGFASIPLTATGTNLLWYANPTGGIGSTTAPTPSTTAIGSTIYYVSQTVNGCEGPRAAITVAVGLTPSIPSTLINPVIYCQGQVATALTAIGSNLLWYNVPSGGTGSSTAPIPTTTTVSSTTYYVCSSAGTCESPRLPIVVTVNASPSAPVVVSPVNYCVGQTAATLTATGTNIKWYTTATGGIGNPIAPTPLTGVANNTSFYATQTTGNCESPRAEINVIVNSIPVLPTITTTNYFYCQGSNAPAISTAGAGTTNLLWYSTPTGGTGSSIIPTPNTTAVSTTNYYVAQSNAACEGPRLLITVTIQTSPGLPTINSANPVSYCQNAITQPLNVTGTNLQWYTVATGGVASTITPAISSASGGTFTYYVAQKLGNCEGPRAAIVVNIVATPTAPTVISPINYCPNNTATPLTAVGTNLLWYATALGGVGSNVAPIPVTNIFPATYNYYVSQSTTGLGCEGPRAQIVVNVDNFLSVNIGADSTICEGGSVKFNPTVTPAATTYTWRAVNVPNSTIDDVSMKDATVKPVDTAQYILTAIFGGCTKEDTVNINVIWKPVLKVDPTKAICLNDIVLLKGFVTRTSSDSIDYLWGPATDTTIATPNALQTNAQPQITTTYTLTYKTKASYGCSFSESAAIKIIVQTVKVFAGNDTIAVKGVPHQLQGRGAVNYNWSSPSGLTITNSFSANAFVTLNDDANIYLKASNANGCEGKDSIFIKVYNGPNYYVPNSFSPNGDGLNDIFRAIPVGMSNTVYFRVFNRLGQLVFETNQWLKGWDGTYLGKAQPNGVYVWTVAGTDRNYKKVEGKGTVSLIR